jgi:PAS domain S-box-containing protein
MSLPNPKPPPLSRIQGIGEMADLIRAKDWTSTPLGPIHSWSETLVAAVNILVLSPFSFAIYWGPQLTLLYNDVYRQFLGEKHPQALGTTGSHVWSEAWSILSPSIHAAYFQGHAMNAAEALIPIHIDGALQDRWWTYGFYPIYEGTRIVGVANPGSEDTASVLARIALQTSESRIRLALAAANAVGTWDWDIPNDCVYADPRLAILYGVEPALARCGTSIQNFLRNIHPEDIERTTLLLQQAIQGKGDFSAEYRILQPDGSSRWVSALGSCSYNVAGQPTRFPGVSVDITDRKNLNEALIRTEKLAAVGKLAATIAHEINNPLESVTNLLYLARTNEPSDQIKDYLIAAERELQRVSIISTQTLRFHKQLSSPVESTCTDLLQSVLSIYQGRLLNANVRVEKRKRATRTVLCFDGEIRQILSTFIGNAIDALQPEGGRLILRSRQGTHWPTGKKGVTFTVADTAAGMPPHVTKRVFEAFFTTKGIGGTGLGLWVSEEIAHRHGGALNVRSSTAPAHCGTVFTLFLPFDAAPRS